jgi:predicted O-methyltransferase YrrM
MIKGQILEESTFGKKISEVIKEYKPSNIVEIGTWKGLGSTLCIIKAIIENGLNNANFISIESNFDFHKEAISNLQEFINYVKLLHGRLIGIDEVVSFCKERKSNVNNNWLVEDLYNMSTNNNIFNQIPNEIDFLLLDGGEYSTYLEWKKLKGRTSIVALDDVVEMKTREINKELDNDPGYEQIILSNDRNGFAIYRKK